MPTSELDTDPDPDAPLSQSDAEQHARDMGDLPPPVDSWARSWSLVCMGIGFLGSVGLGVWMMLVIGASVNPNSVSVTLFLAFISMVPAVAFYGYEKYRVALVLGLLSPAPVCVLFAMLFYPW